MYKNYVRERKDEINAGATHYTAEECMEDDNNIFPIGDGIELEILDSYYYYKTSDTENNHSVCVMINQGDEHFLFTGDLEEEGEEQLVKMNDLPKVALYKAGHHGSRTSSNECLLEVIEPQIVCVCCCAGSSEYTDKSANQFPTQGFIDRIAPYTDKVYVTTLCIDYDNDEFTSMNGNIVIKSGTGGIEVNCSESNSVLKDSEWFKENRRIPSAWE
jgi:beta-lactamase superfamily II metal-dependent hydrolase